MALEWSGVTFLVPTWPFEAFLAKQFKDWNLNVCQYPEGRMLLCTRVCFFVFSLSLSLYLCMSSCLLLFLNEYTFIVAEKKKNINNKAWNLTHEATSIIKSFIDWVFFFIGRFHWILHGHLINIICEALKHDKNII